MKLATVSRRPGTFEEPTRPGGAVLDARGLQKAFGAKLALDRVDLTMQPGEIVALLGRNGAGKTTLASIIAGLVRPDRGQLAIEGIDALRYTKRARRALGYAPQNTGVYETLTVEQNLQFFGDLATGLSRRDLARRIGDVCELLLLDQLRKRRCQTLSGGEKRRLHTAVALLTDPRLLLLDEPTLGADISTRHALLEAVEELAGRGSAVLYTTHYLPEVEQLGAKVVILEAGRIVSQGLLADIVSEGGAGVELTFEGPAPELSIRHLDPVRVGNVVRVPTVHPADVIPLVLRSLGESAERLRAVNVVKPDLESAFLALTGRRFSAEEGAVDAAR